MIEPDDIQSLIHDATTPALERGLAGIVASIILLLATAYALIVATSFNAIVAFERALAGLGLIDPVFAWAFFGALLGIGVGLWRQLPRYGLPLWRWSLLPAPVVLLAMGSMLGAAPPASVETAALSEPAPTAIVESAQVRPKGEPRRKLEAPPTPLRSSANIKTVTATNPHVLDLDGRNSRIRIGLGAQVEILGESGNWLQVRVIDRGETLPPVYIPKSAVSELDKADAPAPEAVPVSRSPVAIRPARIVSRPSGATVMIDNGTFWGVTPFVVRLKPGPHKVFLEKRGYQTRTETIELGANTDEVVFQLQPSAPSAKR